MISLDSTKLWEEDDPDVPKITKTLPIIKWTEAFQDFLNRVIGARMIPLAYVIRNDPQVPGLAPPLAPNQPHSTVIFSHGFHLHLDGIITFAIFVFRVKLHGLHVVSGMRYPNM